MKSSSFSLFLILPIKGREYVHTLFSPFRKHTPNKTLRFVFTQLHVFHGSELWAIFAEKSWEKYRGKEWNTSWDISLSQQQTSRHTMNWLWVGNCKYLSMGDCCRIRNSWRGSFVAFLPPELCLYIHPLSALLIPIVICIRISRACLPEGVNIMEFSGSPLKGCIYYYYSSDLYCWKWKKRTLDFMLNNIILWLLFSCHGCFRFTVSWWDIQACECNLHLSVQNPRRIKLCNFFHSSARWFYDNFITPAIHPYKQFKAPPILRRLEVVISCKIKNLL